MAVRHGAPNRDTFRQDREKTETDRIRKVDFSDDLIASLKLDHAVCLKKALKDGRPLPEWIFSNSEGKSPDMHNVKKRPFKRALNEPCWIRTSDPLLKSKARDLA